MEVWHGRLHLEHSGTWYAVLRQEVENRQEDGFCDVDKKGAIPIVMLHLSRPIRPRFTRF